MVCGWVYLRIHYSRFIKQDGLTLMVDWKHCPVCGRVVDEFEKKCSQCGYDKVWEDEEDDEA